MRAVRFDHYGDVDVLDVVDVAAPVAGKGQVVVRVEATAINPGEAAIRSGAMHERWPATFPSGEGSDLAGVVTEVGAGVDGVSVGDEVIGYTDARASHAELVAVDAEHLTPRPGAVPWEVAGSLYVVGARRMPPCARWACARATSSSCRAPRAVSGPSSCSSRATRGRPWSRWRARITTTGCASTERSR